MALDIQSLTDKSSGWDFEKKHVSETVDALQQSTGNASKLNQFGSIHDIVDSGSTLICAGPASLAKAYKDSKALGGVRVVPIGLVDMAQLSMNKPLNRIFEIGSKLSYIIPGKVVGGISLNRVFFDGPSLLKALYAGEVVKDSFDGENKVVQFSSDDVVKDHNFSPIGSNNIAANLFSGFFDQPFGLAFYFKDQDSERVGSLYFEGCRVGSYGMGIQAQMSVLQESVQIEFVNCVPLVDAIANNTTVRIADSLTDIPIIGS
jgi:hypothetical protein